MGNQEICKKKLNAKFYVRILPQLDFCSECIKIKSDSKVLHVKCLQSDMKVKNQEKQCFWQFTADDIFWNRSQDEVYAIVCQDIVEKASEGVSGLILAYGQSGSGKTFTISGLRHHYQSRGFLLRLLTSFCNEREANCHLKTISISMSYVEFFKSKMKDLFSNKYVKNFKDVQKIMVLEESAAWKMIFDAEVRKSFNEGSPYPSSNAGHTVFTFYVESTSLLESHAAPTHSKIHLVDMSGIDSGKTPLSWRSQPDVGYSNLTKALMEQLILCVTGKTWTMPRRVCPFKTTKLLEYLQDTLQPHCLISFIGHVIGTKANLPLTLSVMRFGEKVRGIQSVCSERDISDDDPLVALKALEVEVERLRTELDLNAMLCDSPNYTNLTKDKLEQIRRAARNFLLGNMGKLTLLSLGQAEITLDVFKEVYERMTREKEQAIRETVLAAIEEVQAQASCDKAHGAASTISPHVKISRRRSSRNQDSPFYLTVPLRSTETNDFGSQKPSTADIHVGQLDRKGGISVGTADISSVFESPVAKALKKIRSRRSDTAVRPEPKPGSVKASGLTTSSQMEFSATESKPPPPEKVPSKEEAWQEFCSEKRDIVEEFQGEISKSVENVKLLRTNYGVALCELEKVREALMRTNREWEDWKHIAQVSAGPSQEDQDDTALRFYSENLRKREIAVDNAVERCHVLLVNLRNGTEALAKTRVALENEFQMYCQEKYKIILIPEEQKIPAAKGDMPAEDVTGSETATNEDKKMKMFTRLQQGMLNYVPKRKKPEWTALF